MVRYLAAATVLLAGCSASGAEDAEVSAAADVEAPALFVPVSDPMPDVLVSCSVQHPRISGMTVVHAYIGIDAELHGYDTLGNAVADHCSPMTQICHYNFEGGKITNFMSSSNTRPDEFMRSVIDLEALELTQTSIIGGVETPLEATTICEILDYPEL